MRGEILQMWRILIARENPPNVADTDSEGKIRQMWWILIARGKSAKCGGYLFLGYGEVIL